MPDLIKPGNQYASLTTVKKLDKFIVHGIKKQRKQPVWLCRCSCGTLLEVGANSLNKRSKKSCGCRRVFIKAGVADPFESAEVI